MKVKVESDDGDILIVMKAENDFEVSVLENIQRDGLWHFDATTETAYNSKRHGAVPCALYLRPYTKPEQQEDTNA